MKAGLVSSTALHAGVLVFALVSFSGAHQFEAMPESMPVDIVSASDFSKLTKGNKTAPKAEKPKQVAEKVAEPTPVEDEKLKVSEKPPVEATAPPPPPPPPPPPQPKVEEKPPTPPKAEAPPKPEPKADESLKAEQKKDDKPQQEEAKAAPIPPRKPAIPKEQPKPVEAQNAPPRDFNADQIKDLLDKRTPTRQVASASQVSSTSSLGAPRGDAQTLSMSEIDAFKARLRQCWAPQGFPDQAGLFVMVNVTFNANGTLSGQPQILGGKDSPYWRALADSAVRALLQCQPYTMLRPEKFQAWKDMELRFTPRLFDG